MKRATMFIIAGIALAAGRIQGQTPAEQKPKVHDNLHELFPVPTGQNGYEDFVLAGDLAANCAVFQEYQTSSDQTLTMMRHVMADPMAQGVLAAVRMGLRKPIAPPRSSVDDETRLPELSDFRNVARLLYVAIYVDLADGRVSQALDLLRDGLLLGYKIQTDTLVSGLVGVAIDAIVMRRIAEHSEQLSARDCERLIGIAQEWIALPDPEYQVLEDERKGEALVLRKYRGDPGKLIDMNLPGAADTEKPKLIALKQTLMADPAATGAAFDEVGRMVNLEIDQAEDNLRKPVWERSDIKQPAASPLASALERHVSIGAMVNQLIDKYSSELASVQMLGVHAAIRRYKWEHNVLPDSIEQLRAGKLAIDPYTGKLFKYKHTGDSTYELYSAGPIDRDPESPNSGKRVPLYVPFRKPAS